MKDSDSRSEIAVDIPDPSHAWSSIIRGLGADPREEKEIKGASGITHCVQAIGVDDKHKRLIVLSSDPDPRTAALMRIDIQMTALSEETH